jgi:hypothetical protein
MGVTSAITLSFLGLSGALGEVLSGGFGGESCYCDCIIKFLSHSRKEGSEQGDLLASSQFLAGSDQRHLLEVALLVQRGEVFLL